MYAFREASPSAHPSSTLSTGISYQLFDHCRPTDGSTVLGSCEEVVREVGDLPRHRVDLIFAVEDVLYGVPPVHTLNWFDPRSDKRLTSTLGLGSPSCRQRRAQATPKALSCLLEEYVRRCALVMTTEALQQESHTRTPRAPPLSGLWEGSPSLTSLEVARAWVNQFRQ